MFSYLLGLFVVLGFCLSLFLIVLLLLNPKKYQNFNNDAAVVIVKLVELHRENLPLNSAHGWNLTPSNCSLRCWQKEFSLNLIGSPVTVYACAKEINCAAVILLNVIADISTWAEWDVFAQDQSVHLELPENPSLHYDPYMQCDQLVLTTSKLKAKPDIEMFRFGNLEKNGTGWILLWSAKHLEWILYVAQPIDYSGDSDTKDSKEKCVLTALWGCSPKQPIRGNSPELLCRKVLNLSESISWSQLNIRPFQSLSSSSLNNPHFPTIHSALIDLPKKPCVLLQHEKKGESASFQNCALAVLPLLSEKYATEKNITRFSLVLYPVKKLVKSINMNGDSPVSEEKRKSRRRHKVRCDSMASGAPRMKHLEIENRRSSSLTAPIRKKPPELTVTVAEEDVKPPQRSSSHSFLDILIPRRHSSDAYERSRSPSPSQTSAPGSVKKSKFSFEKSSSLSSQEDISCKSFYQDPELSDASDVENMLKTAHHMQSESLDLKALGEYSISAVLQENLRASFVDNDAPEEEQKQLSSGWVFKEINKGISVYKKTTTFNSCTVISYLCKGMIPSPHLVVWKTLCNPLTRFMYDDTVKKITVLNEYPSGQKLIHMFNESVTLLRKEGQDFCILQTEKKEKNKFILGFHSVKENVCPPGKDVIRGTVIASGWVVEPVPDHVNLCQVSYLVQMVVNSPEINMMEDISNIQSQCINNLILYLSTKPPCYFTQSDGSGC